MNKFRMIILAHTTINADLHSLLVGLWKAAKECVLTNILNQTNKDEFKREALAVFDDVIVRYDGIPDAYDEIIRPSFEAAVDATLNFLIPG